MCIHCIEVIFSLYPFFFVPYSSPDDFSFFPMKPPPMSCFLVCFKDGGVQGLHRQPQLLCVHDYNSHVRFSRQNFTALLLILRHWQSLFSLFCVLPWALKVLIRRSCLGLSTQRSLSALFPVTSLCISYWLLYKEASLTKAKDTTSL